MKRTKIISTSIAILFCMALTSCSLSEDADDLQIDKLPNIENTDGNAGGTGGETPPPGG